MYMPPAAMIQAMIAPKGPVALAKVLGSEKIPAPTIDPTTIAVNAQKENFWTDAMAGFCSGTRENFCSEGREEFRCADPMAGLLPASSSAVIGCRPPDARGRFFCSSNF